MKEINISHNRCDCRNRVHKFANSIVPELLEMLATGFKLTKSYQLYSSDKGCLQAVIDKHGEKGILSQGSDGSKVSSAFIRSDEYDIKIEITDAYPVRYHGDGSGGRTVEYYKKTVYLWNHSNDCSPDFKGYALYTHEQMDLASTELERVKAEISKLKDREYSLKYLLGE